MGSRALDPAERGLAFVAVAGSCLKTSPLDSRPVLGGAANIKFGFQFIQIGDFRIGAVDDHHFSIAFRWLHSTGGPKTIDIISAAIQYHHYLLAASYRSACSGALFTVKTPTPDGFHTCQTGVHFTN